MANSSRAPTVRPKFSVLASTILIIGAVAGTGIGITGAIQNNTQIVSIGTGLLTGVIAISIFGRYGPWGRFNPNPEFPNHAQDHHEKLDG
jgi:hypothetical protein